MDEDAKFGEALVSKGPEGVNANCVLGLRLLPMINETHAVNGGDLAAQEIANPLPEEVPDGRDGSLHCSRLLSSQRRN